MATTEGCLTPLYCGYELSPRESYYKVTEVCGKQDDGPTMGTAMAVSGAAASPNMGSHSSAAVSFLMAVFNVRLGWWVRNPKKEASPVKSPSAAIWYMVAELFGHTDEESSFVYLSDGGHFENLGLYELVRRRCRVIVVSDAGCDPKYAFEDIGNALRKVRVDFGVNIAIDMKELVKIRQGSSHYALGTIEYSKAYGQQAADGLLVYLKASRCEELPADVGNYAAANEAFPHQSTADQWFDEGQLESYRMLGYHIAKDSLADIEKKMTEAKAQYGEFLHSFQPLPRC